MSNRIENVRLIAEALELNFTEENGRPQVITRFRGLPNYDDFDPYTDVAQNQACEEWLVERGTLTKRNISTEFKIDGKIVFYVLHHSKSERMAAVADCVAQLVREGGK